MKLTDNARELAATLETGCYVSSGWGWRGTGHMVEQFCHIVELDDDENALMELYESGEFGQSVTLSTGEVVDFDNLPDIVIGQGGISDEFQDLLRSVLPEGMTADWRDGEFFVMPHCGRDSMEPVEDDHDPTCACWEW